MSTNTNIQNNPEVPYPEHLLAEHATPPVLPEQQFLNASDLRANAHVGDANQTVEFVMPVVASPELPTIPAPVEVTKQSIGERIKHSFSRAREVLRISKLDREANPNVQRGERRKLIGNLAGALALGLLVSAATPSAGINNAAPAEQVSAKTPTSIVGEAIRVPQKIAVGVEAGTQLTKIAEVKKVIADHPEESKQLLNWIATTKAQNPHITDAQANEQFQNYMTQAQQKYINVQS